MPGMPRKPLRLQGTFPYHVTARSNNREWFYLPTSEVWEICSDLWILLSEKYHARVFEFVLMSNHFHLLISTPDGNLDRIMNYFMREFSRTVGAKTGRINHVFGGRYKGSLIEKPYHFAHVYKYTLRNPVVAGIKNKVQDYPFSTFKRELGSELPFPIEPILSHPLSTLIPKDPANRTEWLNTKYESEQAELLARALKRTTFTFPTHHRHHKTVESLIQDLGQR
jgi:putative transposase